MPVSISRLWNTNENYWILHPQMQTIKQFGNLFDGDKSKGKEKSSRLMWAIALYSDPHDQNPWKNINYLDRQTLIGTDYLKDPKFNWEDPIIKELLKCYEEHCLTIAEKELARLEEKLTQRGDFIKESKYTLDEYEETERGVKLKKGTAEQLDKMMVNTTKIYEQLEIIKTMLSKESNGANKGGSKQSAGEKKAI